MTETILCKFDFSAYPFDSHVCKVMLGSSSDDISHVVFTSHFALDKRLQNILQYEVRFEELEEASKPYKLSHLELSVTGIDIYLRR